MSSYDPGKPPSWEVSQSSSVSYGSSIPDAQPTTNGDRWALAALAVTVTTLISCIPFVNCLAPFVPLVVGIIALMQVKSAADPQRARLYGWIATGFGILFLLAIVFIIVVYGAFIASIINNPDFQRELQRQR